MPLTTRRPTAAVIDPGPELDPDVVEKLPVGYRDPRSPNYVEPAYRRAVADYSPKRWGKLRRSLYMTGAPVVRTVNGTTHVIDPSDSETALDIVTLWLVLDDLRRQRKIDTNQAEREAYDVRTYTCQCCGQVAAPSTVDRRHHTQRRQLAGGMTIIGVCGKCAIVAEQLAVERLAADKIDGLSRADRLRQLLDKPTS
jgi:hypothetical protein